MRKQISSGQKWILRPYFPLIRGMFEFRSGLRFSFLALEVPELRVWKRSFRTFPHLLLLLTSSGTSSGRNENLKPLLNTNIPLIGGIYGHRNHFWPLESRFLMRKSEKKGPNSKSPDGRVLISWNLILYIHFCAQKKKSPWIICLEIHFSLYACSGPMWATSPHVFCLVKQNLRREHWTGDVFGP